MTYTQKAEGLDELVRELELIPDELLDAGEKMMGRAMLNIKRDAQKDVRSKGWTHLPHLARSFGYDVTRTGRIIRGEAGADMDKLQGKLDVYIENGTSDTPANAHWTRAFDAELPRFEKYAEEYLEKLLAR